MGMDMASHFMLRKIHGVIDDFDPCLPGSFVVCPRWLSTAFLSEIPATTSASQQLVYVS